MVAFTGHRKEYAGIHTGYLSRKYLVKMSSAASSMPKAQRLGWTGVSRLIVLDQRDVVRLSFSAAAWWKKSSLKTNFWGAAHHRFPPYIEVVLKGETRKVAEQHSSGQKVTPHKSRSLDYMDSWSNKVLGTYIKLGRHWRLPILTTLEAFEDTLTHIQTFMVHSRTGPAGSPTWCIWSQNDFGDNTRSSASGVVDNWDKLARPIVLNLLTGIDDRNENMLLVDEFDCQAGWLAAAAGGPVLVWLDIGDCKKSRESRGTYRTQVRPVSPLPRFISGGCSVGDDRYNDRDCNEGSYIRCFEILSQDKSQLIE
ncbi:uncharacterized protein BDR25DRAFT_308342 [Lindgomyces ingoldianus]|uniref:Uncharacterized protein n=1 Tax=Lindgomyces ingoldianus TaxID=673940 RepID=A0ACB6RDJ0_9PLEO|nr:uncharacterized protein BDR25DRAFT_308342 [Lindgomyces ingoldianus]KAF2477408.1 hypothetical protein BDR25DRAFT_308342 [Lindgomyces ingoldianus]